METKTNRYQNPTLEASIKSSCLTLRESIKNDSEHFAKRNLPRLVGDNMRPYSDELHLESQALIDEVNMELQVETLQEEASEKKKSSELETKDLNNKLRQAKDTQNQVHAKCKNVKLPFIPALVILACVVLVLIYLSEGALSIPVFELYGLSLKGAIFMGIAFGFLLGASAHFFMPFVNLGKTLFQRRLIAIGLILFHITLFAYMAITRANYLSGAGSTNTVDDLNLHFSPIPFFCMSFLLFMIAVYISHVYIPSIEEIIAYLECWKLKRNKRNIDAEIEKLEGQLKAMQQSESNSRCNSVSIAVFGHTLEKMIVDNAHSAYSQWQNHNLMYRIDNGKPDCFDDPYPFSFRLNFQPGRSGSQVNQFSAIACLLLAFACTSCNQVPKTVEKEVRVIIDVSDPVRVKPDADILVAQLGLKDDTWQGVRVVTSYLSDKDVNPVHIISLENADEMNTNKQIRAVQVARFKKQLRSVLTAHSLSDTLNHSIIYRVLARHLNELSASKAKNRYMLVYSDLMENAELSLYDPVTLAELRERPDTFLQKLKKEAPLSDLTGLSVWFLYDPDSYEANTSFIAIARVYEQLLTSNGASVHIQSSLNL